MFYGLGFFTQQTAFRPCYWYALGHSPGFDRERFTLQLRENVFAHAGTIIFLLVFKRLVLVRHCTDTGAKERETTRRSDLSTAKPALLKTDKRQ